MTEEQKTLRTIPFNAGRILLTGASGYVGGLVAATLLTETDAQLVLPVRSSRESRLLERLNVELAARGKALSSFHKRILVLEWPSAESGTQSLSHWGRTLDHLHLEEIIHCAGCLDYFDENALRRVNEELTGQLLELGEIWDIRRFVYISTAYAAGYLDVPIREALAHTPAADPTYYTRSKRRAEWRVANSNLPWLILRPSILIGEHAQGRYSGKRYGLYQQWMGLERLLTNKYHEEIHTIAPKQPLNLLHQDVFQESFLAAWQWIPDGTVCNLVSREDTSPSMRDLWNLWLSVVRPKRVHYYQRFEDVDLMSIDLRQRAYLTFAQVNLEIGAHSWRFERSWLEELEKKGLCFHDVTIDSVTRCQNRFVQTSVLLQKYINKYHQNFPKQIEIIEELPHVLEQTT